MPQDKRANFTISLQIKILAVLCVAFVLLSLAMRSPQRSPVASAETNFAETSAHGASIMPASCASGPQYFHFHAYTSADNRGFVAYTGEVEFGASLAANTAFLCFTNVSGATYYIPANTLAEVNAFKAATLSGVTKW